MNVYDFIWHVPISYRVLKIWISYLSLCITNRIVMCKDNNIVINLLPYIIRVVRNAARGKDALTKKRTYFDEWIRRNESQLMDCVDD